MPSPTDKKYKNYLLGKSVALVGPASYLTDLSLGTTIDSYDVVVRVNRGIELIDKYGDHTGRRTDILYNCLIEHPDNGGKIDIKFLKNHKVSWISTVPGSGPDGLCESNKLHGMVKVRTFLKIRMNFRCHVMDWRDYGELNKTVGCRANTGFAAIFDLLNHGVGSLFITGFSFYLDSFMSGYKNGCERDEEEFAFECFNSKRHLQATQWSYLKGALERFDNIAMDPVFRVIMGLNSLSKTEYQKALNLQ